MSSQYLTLVKKVSNNKSCDPIDLRPPRLHIDTRSYVWPDAVAVLRVAHLQKKEWSVIQEPRIFPVGTVYYLWRFFALPLCLYSYHLSRDQIQYGLPQINVYGTVLGDVCALPPSPPCSCRPGRFREIDGFCNNPYHPDWGRSYTAFQRFLPPFYEDGKKRKCKIMMSWNPHGSLNQFRSNDKKPSNKMFCKAYKFQKSNALNIQKFWNSFFQTSRKVDFCNLVGESITSALEHHCVVWNPECVIKISSIL